MKLSYLTVAAVFSLLAGRTDAAWADPVPPTSPAPKTVPVAQLKTSADLHLNDPRATLKMLGPAQPSQTSARATAQAERGSAATAVPEKAPPTETYKAVESED